MRVKIWYDGSFTCFESTYNQTSKGNLKHGGSSQVGRYGSQSRRKFVARCAYMYDHRGALPVYSTCLTYRDQPTNQATMSNMNAFLQYMRRKGMVSYAWALEYQERKKSGLPMTYHYHLMINAPYVPVKEVNDAWSRIRGDHAANAVRDHRIIKNVSQASGYASKYASYCIKANDMAKHHVIPSDLRLWATSTNLVGVESFTIDDTSFVLGMIEKGQDVNEKVLDTGFTIWQGKLNRIQFFNALRFAAWQRNQIEMKSKELKQVLKVSKPEITQKTFDF